jgi:hypothetical protein
MSHFESSILNILNESPALSFSDLYHRMIKHEHLGLAVEHIPYRYYFSDHLNGNPGIFSYTDEFVISKLEELSYIVPVVGKRNLILHYKIQANNDDVAIWKITFHYDETTLKYIADIEVDLSSTIMTGSVEVDSVGTEYLNFFISFAPSPYQGNVNNILYHATFKLSNGVQQANWHDIAPKTVLNIWNKNLYLDLS